MLREKFKRLFEIEVDYLVYDTTLVFSLDLTTLKYECEATQQSQHLMNSHFNFTLSLKDISI